MQNNASKRKTEFTAAQWETLDVIFASGDKEQQLENVRSMFSAGLSPYAVKTFGSESATLAEIAAARKSWAVVLFLQNEYPSLVNESHLVLCRAIEDEETFTKMLEGGYPLSEMIARNPQLIDDLCVNRQATQRTLRALVEHGLQLDVPATILGSVVLPLNWLAQTHRTTRFKNFLGAGARADMVDDKGRHFLHHAVAEGLVKRSDRDDEPESCAHLAEILAEAVARGVSLDVQDKDGNTPLHVAAKMGYINKVRLLLEHGASGQLANHKGKTPAKLAKACKRPDIVQVIAAANAQRAVMDVASAARNCKP